MSPPADTALLAALDVKLRAAVHAAPAEARTPEAR